MAPLVLTPPPKPSPNPVIELNETVPRETTPESAPGVVKTSGSSIVGSIVGTAIAVADGGDAAEREEREDVEATFPAGIDYAKWEKGVTAAPRDAFADRLDLLDADD